MSGEYSYEFPDSKEFLHTLRMVIEARQEIHLSELLQSATCTFSSSSQYSHRRWDTYSATLRIRVMPEKFGHFSDEVKERLLGYATDVFPPDAGYELMTIEVSPLLSAPPNDSILATTSVTEALQRLHFNPIWGEPATDDNYTCDVFMVMPFRPELDDVYAKIIAPIVKELGFSIKRGDDPFTTKDIMFDIWSLLNACRLVIADCTGRNPNVFYELGIAHTLGKPVIMITQDLSEQPFDVISKRAIQYSTNFSHVDDFKDELKRSVLSILTTKASPNTATDFENELPF